MKTIETIIFSKYTDTDDLGALRQLTDDQIKECMKEYAYEFAVQFLGWYIGGTPSKFEVQKVVTGFLNSDYLKELQK